jgi:hypothetical protein
VGAWLLNHSKHLTGGINKAGQLENQFHQKVELLGTVRSAFVDCIREAVKMQNSKLNMQLANNNTVLLLLGLCVKHKFNGILHSLVRIIILELLKGEQVRSLVRIFVI